MKFIMKLTIMCVNDYWGNSSVWINGELQQSGWLTSSDCFGMMADYFKRITKSGPVTFEGVEYIHFKLSEQKATCDDIPEYVVGPTTLKDWYNEVTGKVLEVTTQIIEGETK